MNLIHPGNSMMMAPVPIVEQWSGQQSLSAVNRFLVSHKIDFVQGLNGWNETDKFTIKNGANEVLYYAFLRGFVGHIVDRNNKEIYKLTKGQRCFNCCCCLLVPLFGPLSVSCYRKDETVIEKDGNRIGSVKFSQTLVSTKSKCYDSSENQCLEIEGKFHNGIKTEQILRGNSSVGSIITSLNGNPVSFSRLVLKEPMYALTADFPMDLPENEKVFIMTYLIIEQFVSCNTIVSSHHGHYHRNGFSSGHGRRFGRRR